MGKIIKISAQNITPSQNYIKEDTIKFILTCIFRNKLDKLPPTPIVRKHPQNNNHYIAIDGHNLIIINDLRNIEIEVYVAEFKDDKLEGKTSGIIKRNKDLKEKFDKVTIDIQKLKQENIQSFEDLRNKYKFLNNMKDTRKYFQLN